MDRQDNHVVLVGPRGAGKSAVGLRVSAALGLPLLETDRLVEGEAGATVAALITERGEAAFRALESAVLLAVLDGPPAVVSTGGGVVLDEGNRRALARAGTVAYLYASPLVLHRRITADPASASLRPPLTGLDPLQEVETLLRRRDPLYRAVSTMVMDTSSLTVEAAAADLVSRLDSA